MRVQQFMLAGCFGFYGGIMTLKPCPFCGSRDIQCMMPCSSIEFPSVCIEHSTDSRNRWVVGIQCLVCGARVGEFDPEQDVVEVWNTRAAEKKLSEQQWIKCSDRLPDDFKPVIVCDNRSSYKAHYDGDIECFVDDWSETSLNKINGYDITHWMELPKLPEAKDG